VFGIGMTELMVIFVIGLLVLGPKRLPELARSLGKGLAEFRRASTDLRQEFMDVADSARIDPSDLDTENRGRVEDGEPAQANQDPEPTSPVHDDGPGKTPAD
jgi:sec-independent protein translocase protein TatA